MNLDKKTSLIVSFYDHDTKEIHSWPFKCNQRIALFIHHLVNEKNKIDITKEEEVEKSLDFLTWDLKKLLTTPYTPEENV